MEVRLITATGAALRPLEDLARLLGSGTGFVWLDIGEWDDAAERVLTDTFRFNPMAIRDCAQRNQVPKVHVYADHVFVVLHAPQAGKAGHVHYIELDQFIGTNYLVTVHGPVNPAVDPTATRVEVDAVLHRLDNGRMHPATPRDLSYAVVSALTGRLRTFTATLTKDVWRLEQQVTAGHLGDPEQFQEDMFRVRHGLLTVQTMCSLSHQVYGRMGAIAALGQRGQQQIDDLVDQFQRLGRDGRRAEGLPAGHHRLLPDPHQHQDDHRRREAGGDRRGDPSHHRVVLRPGDERHRQREHPGAGAGRSCWPSCW